MDLEAVIYPDKPDAGSGKVRHAPQSGDPLSIMIILILVSYILAIVRKVWFFSFEFAIILVFHNNTLRKKGKWRTSMR